MKKNNDKVLIFFDTECILCNGFVNFCLDRSPSKLMFGPVSSDKSERILPLEIRNKGNSTIIVYSENKIYLQSTAILIVLKKLGFPYYFLSLLIIIPEFVRDIFYNIISTNRHKWFGKTEDRCRYLTEEEKRYFFK